MYSLQLLAIIWLNEPANSKIGKTINRLCMNTRTCSHIHVVHELDEPILDPTCSSTVSDLYVSPHNLIVFYKTSKQYLSRLLCFEWSFESVTARACTWKP